MTDEFDPSKIDNSHLFKEDTDEENLSKEQLVELVEFLRSELVKKNEIIEHLKQESSVIMSTAIKNAQERIKSEDIKKKLNDYQDNSKETKTS